MEGGGDLEPLFAEYELGSSTRMMYPLSSTDLTDEMVIDILARLPVKTLGRFRCVSKLWYSLIGDSPFFNAHLEHTRLRNHSNNKRRKDSSTSNKNNDNEEEEDGSSHIVLIPPPGSRDPCQLLCEKTYVQQGTLETPYKTGNSGWDNLEVLGPCNGTVALVDFDIRRSLVHVHMWNPIIRRFKTVPPVQLYATATATAMDLAHDIFVFGLGYDASTNDYKIVKFMYKYDDKGSTLPCLSDLVQVYSLNTNRWKKIEATSANVVPAFALKYPSAHKGFIHWMAVKTNGGKFNRNTIIMRFDVGKELFGEMGCPSCWGDTTTDPAVLGVVHDSLCAVVKPVPSGREDNLVRSCDVWVMKEYGLVESWTKQYSVVFDSGMSEIFGLTVDGKLMCSLTDDDDDDNGQRLVYQWLVIYDPQTSAHKLIRKFNSIHLCHFFSFTDSLVLLDYC